MALQKQSININFAKGLDTKTDKNQVDLSNFLALSNSVFDVAGQLTKRNGFGLLPSLNDITSSFLTTHNDNLLALGNNFQALSTNTGKWITKGSFQDVDLNVTPLVRTADSQLTVDSVIAANGAVCTVYLNSDGEQYYTVQDSTTGEILVQSTVLAATSTNARVCLLGGKFIITYLIPVGLNFQLRYIAIPSTLPESPAASALLATDVLSATTGYDIVVTLDRMFFAYTSNVGSSAVKISYLSSTLIIFPAVTLAGTAGDLISLCVDNSSIPLPTVYLTYYDNGTQDTSTAIYNYNLSPVTASTVVQAGVQIGGLTSAAVDAVCSIFFQIPNTYSYSSVSTDYVTKAKITQLGTVVPAAVLLRSVGLGSKACVMGSKVYLLTNYPNDYQPSYFLVDATEITGKVIAKLAYSNAIQYANSQVLPQTIVNGSVITVGYLIRTLLVPVNKSVNADASLGVYAQTGINLATFNLNGGDISAREIAGALHLTGGFPWMYDGAVPVEHNFFVWPEDLGVTAANTGGGLKKQKYFYAATYEWTDLAGNVHRSAPSVPLEFESTAALAPVTTTASFASGSTTLTVASAAGLFIGQQITDVTTPARFQALTRITAINGTTITINNPTLSAAAADTISTDDTFSNTIKVPTLRLTYKTGPSSVRIVIYRWSQDLQIFYQVTPTATPINNDTTIDSITFVDTQNTNAIIGGVQLYTTGGVLENIQTPACTVSTLFKSRLFSVVAEDRNSIDYSKPVIAGVPVEMTPLQRLYIAPTTGGQGSTGKITVLASMDDKIIIFKQSAIYYITGDGPDITGANSDYGDPVFITASVGCTNPNSVVITPDGLMFQSDKGIWILRRDLSTNYIGAEVEQYNSQKVISALLIPGTNQVRFTLEGNDQPTLMYDYYYAQWGTFTGIPAVSSTLYNNRQTFVNSFGQVLQETPGQYLDGSRPVRMSFTTAWAKFAGLQGFQRAYFCYLLANYKSPHTLTITIAYDYDPNQIQQVVINPVNWSGYYGDDPIYGNESPYGGQGQIEAWRIFFERQKCESFRISVQENFDSLIGAPAGAGLSMSGLNLVYGVKKGYNTLRPSYSVG